MKKFNAQAEAPSTAQGPMRTSRLITEVLEQNTQASARERHAPYHLLTQKHTATGRDHHAPYHLLTQNAQADLVPLRDVSAIFFIFYLDYKHKHTADPLGSYRAHALNL